MKCYKYAPSGASPSLKERDILADAEKMTSQPGEARGKSWLQRTAYTKALGQKELQRGLLAVSQVQMQQEEA